LNATNRFVIVTFSVERDKILIMDLHVLRHTKTVAFPLSNF